MSLKRRAFDAASDLVIAALGLNRPNRLYSAFFGRIDAVARVDVGGVRMAFDANKELHLLRARWLESKEPDTLRWIDSFDEGAILFDIGANIGVFSIYAALRRNCTVYAFEPEAKNYACLNRNLYLNGLGAQTHALNVGLHDSTRLARLQLHGLESGAALHSLGDPIDWRGERFVPKYEQSVLAYMLDELIQKFALPAPTHLKLDVDGNEERIIRGAQRTLSDLRLASLLVEVNPSSGNLVALIESHGFKLAEKTPLNARTSGGTTYNAIFRRS